MFRKICKYNEKLGFKQRLRLFKMQQPKFTGPNTGKEETEEKKPGFFWGVLFPLALTFCFFKGLIYWYGK